MQDKPENKKSEGGGVNMLELVQRLLAELAEDPSNITVMLGVIAFNVVQPNTDAGHQGGVEFQFKRKHVRNKSRKLVLTALPNGKRRMEWYDWEGEAGEPRLVDQETDIDPKDLEKVWWEHTGCAIRPPWILDAFKKRKFELGQTLATKNAHDTFTHAELQRCFNRHSWGDWGNVDAEDRASNERGLDKEEPGRLMSVYKFPDGRVLWIITEWDRSATTALLPEDY